MEFTEESDALNEIQDLEVRLEKSLEKARREAREIVKSAGANAAAMVSEKEKELSRARRAVMEEAGRTWSGEIGAAATDIKPDDNLARKLADEILKVIIR